MAEATELYDLFAATYEESFEAPSLRRVYDELAWSHVASRLPAPPATIVDVGCGTGRWVRRCLAAGHNVIGIEPSSEMRRIMADRLSAPRFTLLPHRAEDAEIPPSSAHVVLAMGSLQYVADPAATLQRMVGWLRIGGLLFVHVDGLVALVLELLRLGRAEEALRRLDDGWGIFTFGGRSARLHLFDRVRLAHALGDAGLTEVQTRGLLISPSALGRDACEKALDEDESNFVAIEQLLSYSPAMTDAGKHIIGWGRKG